MPEFEFLQQLTPYLLGLGLVGLFLLALIDSAGLPTGGGPDLLLLILTVDAVTSVAITKLVAATVAGSTLGCLALYLVGQRGGMRIFERLVHARRNVIEERIKSHGLWAISLAMMSPPPYPTKVFVISAGVFRMAVGAFLSSVVLGRLLRYGLVGLLAAWLGPTAEAAIMAHYPTVFSGLLVIAGLSLLVRRLRRRAVVVKCSTAASANAATAVLAAGGGVAGGNGGRR